MQRVMASEAIEFLCSHASETGAVERPRQRIADVQALIGQTGTYWHTEDELIYGSKVAWRNTPQCIGRFYWKHLKVQDMRHLATAEEIFAALVEHLRLSTNGGKIQLLLTVFAPQAPGKPGIRILNSQLVRYAGYRQPDGHIVGDPATVEFTEFVRVLGWEGRGGWFDILPVAIQMPGESPRIFTLPSDTVLEVPISHPEYPWFADLGLRWYSHPTIASSRLDIGGISYTAAPFSGWYTGAEIGGRNLSDEARYNMLPVIARRMGLDTRSDRTLWKDRALVELNVAVMHSFTTHCVSMIDHHYAARQFVRHEAQEALLGRCTPGEWRMLVSPISPATTAIYHHSYDPTPRRPAFFPQESPWKGGAPGCGWRSTDVE